MPTTLWRAGVLALALMLTQQPRPATTISGRVLDAASNEPLAGASVSLTLFDVPSGTTAPGPVQTNERGEFSFTNLSPGRYSLSAQKPRYLNLSYGQRPGSGLPGVSVMATAGQPVKDVVIRLPLASVIAGMVTDLRGEPAQGAFVSAYRLQWRNGERGAQSPANDVVDDRGQYRIPNLPPGEYLILATMYVQAPPQPVPTYYPGTPMSALATPIALGISEERTGINVQVNSALMSTVTGTVTSADGRPVRGAMIMAVDTESMLVGQSNRQTYSSADGGFTFQGLLPGRYQLLASENTPVNPASRRWAAADVIADGNPVKDVSLVLQEGETVSGTVVLEGTAKLTSATRLTLSPLARIDPNSASFSAYPDPEGRFTMTGGVLPGRYVLGSAYLPSGYLISSVQLNGREVSDLPIDVGPSQPIRALEVRITSKGASLSGTVFDAAGRPSSDLLVVIFPADEKYWLPGSTRVRTARPGNDGRYSVPSLPPGSYLAGVVTEAEPGEWFAPPFLKKLAPTAIPVSLLLGEAKGLDVRVK